MENMRIKLGAVALASSMIIGAGIGITTAADAQTDPVETQEDRMQRHEERLQAKVDEGVITQERADDIRARWENRAEFREARQADRAELKTEIAATLGTTADDLTADLRSGTSLADAAEAAGVDINIVIDQIEAHRVDQLTQAVADGRIDQADADAKLETLRDDITARVNGERPEGRRGFGRHGRGGN